MSLRSRFISIAAILLGVAAFFFWRREAAPVPAPIRPPAAVVASTPPPAPTPAPAVTPTPEDAGSPIANDLNAPAGTIRRDLQILDELFGAFHTNFPRLGNPVGENHEITAALLGDNPAKFPFLSRSHRALNAKGELCDRWGTPFRFHQISGTTMEIRSAGPDRKFGTPDDAVFPP